jgi:hypothetical protein
MSDSPLRLDFARWAELWINRYDPRSAKRDYSYFVVENDVSVNVIPSLRTRKVRWQTVFDDLFQSIHTGTQTTLARTVYYSARTEKRQQDEYYRTHPDQAPAEWDFD